MGNKHILSVGDASLDVQHKLLVTLVEGVVAGLNRGEPDAVLHHQMAEFHSALASHFAAEEGELAACGFRGAQDHAVKHVEVLARLDQAIAAFNQVTSTAARFAILNEIEDVLYGHEIEDDTEYAGYLGISSVPGEWDEAFRIGIDWIDEQHKQLFVMLKIFRRHAGREEWEMCRFVFNRLVDRVRTHFDNEDTYLKTLGSAAFGHRRHHLDALLTLEDLLAKTDEAALRKIDGFLFQLLRDHILAEDLKDMAPFSPD